LANLPCVESYFSIYAKYSGSTKSLIATTSIFGPLTLTPANDDNIIVLVGNVWQISVSNYNILYNYLGGNNAFIEFTSPVPIGTYVTIYYGYV
jgi:hypothetical protein